MWPNSLNTLLLMTAVIGGNLVIFLKFSILLWSVSLVVVITSITWFWKTFNFCSAAGVQFKHSSPYTTTGHKWDISVVYNWFYVVKELFWSQCDFVVFASSPSMSISFTAIILSFLEHSLCPRWIEVNSEACSLIVGFIIKLHIRKLNPLYLGYICFQTEHCWKIVLC